MSQRYSAPAWLFWVAAVALIVLTTRNPVYLGLILFSVIFVYLGLERRSSIALAWTTVLRIGMVIAVISVLFNVLTVHIGDRQFARLPDSWPIIGGPLTVNAAVYGLISGLALLCLLLIAATLSTAVDRSALVRMMPQSLGTIAIAGTAALSMFPQTIAAIGQVREAHRARGLQLRSVRDIRRLIIPVMNLGLERAFGLAETMESRGFGNRQTGLRIPGIAAVMTLLILTTSVVLIGTGYAIAGIVAFMIAISLFFLVARRHRNTPVARYRTSQLNRGDWPLLLASVTMIGITAFELASGSPTLNYSTYPVISFPDLNLWMIVATLLSATPVRRWAVARGLEPGHA
jgi:energy-coupling factor transport system permease protein